MPALLPAAPLWFAAIVAAHTADLALTVAALSTGLFREANPFAVRLWDTAGALGLTLGKVALFDLLAAVYLVALELADVRAVRWLVRSTFSIVFAVGAVVSWANAACLVGALRPTISGM